MNRDILSKIEQEQMISREELEELLTTTDQELIEELYRRARATAGKYYGKEIYLRGLIEFTNYCKNNCYYCGIRCGNEKAQRYRLTMDQILSCCESGWELGFRTFVLQGGEDPYYTDERICTIIKEIKKRYPDCAVTLSIGEKERASYQAYFDAGADRYLLRHETADEVHYQKLHPSQMSLAHRKQCLRELKEIGYQTGCGFMVGSPGQTVECLVEDFEFLQELKPHMIGIGPFLAHQDTPFGAEENGSYDQTLLLLSILRLMFPGVLLPATTALGTIAPDGREQGLLAGANVLMPNLSPVSVRKKYELYDNKICTGEESAQCKDCLSRRVESVGYRIVTDRGDSRIEK